MATATTSTVYIHVIQDVINKVRDEFIGNGGPGEAVLLELQGSWEKRMMEAGEILGPIDRTSTQRAGANGPITPNPVHDLNVPYEGTEEYETPTADLLFPPTPMQTPLPGSAQTPLPGMAQTPLAGTTPTPFAGSYSGAFYNIPTGGTPITPDEYTSNNENGGLHEIKGEPGRPSSHMQPPSAWGNQRHPVDVNVAYEEGREEVQRGASHQQATQDFFMPSGKRKRDGTSQPYNASGYIPQQDGAGDNLSDELKESQSGIQQMFVQGSAFSSRIPQLDGQLPDPYDDMLSTPNIYSYQGVVNEDYNVANTPMPPEMQAATPAPIQNDAGDDDDDEPLNEDDDDEDDLDDEDDGEGPNTMHLVLAQFDKVTRTKSRWKCALKNGIMHINNRDVLFNKATGEFDF